jgi:hypothetical protein
MELLGIEVVSGEPVVWCGLHDIDWRAVQQGANPLPGGLSADRHCYVRFDVEGLPPLEVH